uniref:Uncharacterized protein n=1 Tax=Anguilla anguilla TaxID=7936 RepID=A0A0E9Y2K9_ANGAN
MISCLSSVTWYLVGERKVYVLFKTVPLLDKSGRSVQKTMRVNSLIRE